MCSLDTTNSSWPDYNYAHFSAEKQEEVLFENVPLS